MVSIVSLHQGNLEGKLNPFVLPPCNFWDNRDGSEHSHILGLVWESEIEGRDEVDKRSLNLNQPTRIFVVSEGQLWGWFGRTRVSNQCSS